MLTDDSVEKYNVKYELPKNVTFRLRYKVSSGMDHQISEARVTRRNREASERYHPPDLCRVGCANFKWSGSARSRPFVGVGVAQTVCERIDATDKGSQCAQDVARIHRDKASILGATFLGKRLLTATLPPVPGMSPMK